MTITDTITILGNTIINLINTRITNAISANNMEIDEKINNLQEQINNMYGTEIGAPYVKESYKDSYTWYRIWSDGWIECGGSTTISRNSTITVTLPVEYSDTYYNVHVSWGQRSNIDDNITCSAETTTTIMCYCSEIGANDGYGSQRFYWSCRGF